MLLLILFLSMSLVFLVLGCLANTERHGRNLGPPGMPWSISVASLLPVSAAAGIPVGFMVTNLMLLGAVVIYWALDTAAEETA